MTIAVLCAIGASFLLSFANHIDKFVINESFEFDSIKSLLVFSTLVAGIIFFPISYTINDFNFTFDLICFLVTFVSAIFFILATYFYFIALEITDASIVVSLQQTVPIFSLILTFIFFNEVLTPKELLGMLIIIVSTIVMSMKKINGSFNFKPLLYMFLFTISSSLYFFIFEIGVNITDYNTSNLSFQLSLFIIGLIFLLFKSYRDSFFFVIDKRKRETTFNIINEIFTLVANMLNNYANTIIPLAMVNALNGFQVVFTFLIGLVGVIILPKYFIEDIDKKNILKKVICIVFEIIGLFIMTNY